MSVSINVYAGFGPAVFSSKLGFGHDSDWSPYRAVGR